MSRDDSLATQGFGLSTDERQIANTLRQAVYEEGNARPAAALRISPSDNESLKISTRQNGPGG